VVVTDELFNKSYLIGGGIGSLAAAAFLVRDGGITGGNITIFKTLPVLGESLDDAGSVHDEAVSLKGSRHEKFRLTSNT
jgi:oleate hydratase